MVNNFSYKTKYYFRQIIKYTPFYRNIFRNILLKEDSGVKLKKIENIVRYAIDNVPYYKNYSEYIKDGFDVNKIPFIQKEDVQKNGESMVSERFNKKCLLMISTGGTTGPSVNVYQTYKESVVGTAYTNYAFSLLGHDLVVCSIREHDLREGESYRFFGNRLMLAPNLIAIDSIEFYIDLLRKYGVNCLHVYPTSLLMLCKLIEKKYGGQVDLPIKGILVSSEIFSKETKLLAKRIFPDARIVDFYSQTEMVCCAFSIDFMPVSFIDSFAYTEFMDTGMKRNGNKIAEIVSTGFYKKSMPLIRYATGDFVEMDEQNNVVSIIGRTSDFLIGKNGEVIPCIIVNREDTMKNVIL